MDYQQFKRQYKLIAFDIDMTLTNHDREVHDEDKAILQQLNKSGVHIALASGRMTHSILKFAQTHLGFETDVIAYNGAMVWVQGNDKPVSHEPLPFETALKIAELENIQVGEVLSSIKSLRKIFAVGKDKDKLLVELQKVEKKNFKVGGSKRERLELHIEKEKQKTPPPAPRRRDKSQLAAISYKSKRKRTFNEPSSNS